MSSQAGIAPIKSEYLVRGPIKQLNLDHVSEGDKILIAVKREATNEDGNDGAPKEKKLKGQNKYRKNAMRRDAWKNQPRIRLCHRFVSAKQDEKLGCNFATCNFSHDVPAYLEAYPRKEDIGESCFRYHLYGYCPQGVLCRFAQCHLDKLDNVTNLIDKEKWDEWQPKMSGLSRNVLGKDVQVKLRKKQYDFNESYKIIKEVTAARPESENQKRVENTIDPVIIVENNEHTEEKPVVPVIKVENLEHVEERPVGPVIKVTKKPINFKNKLYLAPLTTVGNLPFRRIAKQYGAEITCGEMAMAQNILEGQQSEWALLRRHACEDVFGVQVCGAHADMMTKTCQLIREQCDVDFVDLNMGCPIELVCKKGAGSGLMAKSNKLQQIVDGMYQVLGEINLTLKLRTGIYNNKNVAHRVIESIKERGSHRVALFTLHGRSKEARYTRSADWDYIEECAKVADPVPLYGSGDIMSYEDLDAHINSESGVTGAMLGRGALIKPWIFTELKERRHWDISSNERLDMLKGFTNYGLEHWGSDDSGVEKTRRFLLEWLSFTCRYIPVGLLEVLPQKINERPFPYRGRDDLETLMASSYCNDWLKISEMLLGPVPESFVFLPKHKANAYSYTSDAVSDSIVVEPNL